MSLAQHAPDPCSDFLACHGLGRAVRVPLAGDASARRYERIATSGGPLLLMDMSAAPADLHAFCAIATRLEELGLSVPRVLAQDEAAGLALIEDFGDDVFGRLLPQLPVAGQRQLYRLAVDVLIRLHTRFNAPGGITRRWDAALFAEQSTLYLEQWRPGMATEPFRRIWRDLLARFDARPQSLLLRDYHVDNLMRLDRPGVAAAGVIDFQDAGLGTPLYDLVSLVEDVRRPVAPARRRALIRHYAAAMNLDVAALEEDLTILAAQRHTRILGVFRRLVAQGRDRYAPLIPPTQSRLRHLLRAPVLAELRGFYALSPASPRT